MEKGLLKGGRVYIVTVLRHTSKGKDKGKLCPRTSHKGREGGVKVEMCFFLKNKTD